MAVFKTSDSVGAREDLSDVITRIDPDTTPIYSNLEKIGTKGIIHQWQVQELASAVDNNAQAEGSDYSYANPTATTIFTNVHQIFIQAGSVSGTLDVVDKAGRDRETAYVKVLKGINENSVAIQ